jgi:hypothetical protein
MHSTSSHILIAGDSWGRGEWNLECTTVLHSGLQHYLENDGYTVTNISKGGNSNLDTVDRLSHYLDHYSTQLPDLTLVFQTEYTRDFKHHAMQQDFGSADFSHIKTIDDLIGCWIERFYMRLSELSVRCQVPIFIIGGCSDTMAFDNMNLDYPGCTIACQSMVNLIIEGCASISSPVFSWYNSDTEALVTKVRTVIDTKNADEILKEIDKGYERCCLLKENPEYFYPDGKHPNKLAHRILYDYLQTHYLCDYDHMIMQYDQDKP